MKETFTLTFQNPDYEDKEITVSDLYNSGFEYAEDVKLQYGDIVKYLPFKTFIYCLNMQYAEHSVVSTTDNKRIRFLAVRNPRDNHTQGFYTTIYGAEIFDGYNTPDYDKLFPFSMFSVLKINLLPYEKFEVILENKTPNIPFFSGLYK